MTLKQRSLAPSVHHDLEDPAAFSKKIAKAKAACLSDEMLIFARIESLIAGAGHHDALQRARAYLGSEADGIVIHSKDETGAEVFAFLEGYSAVCEEVDITKPLVCIPTAYNFVTDRELFERGDSIVIHANHQLRPAYKAMTEVCTTVLTHDRSREADALCVGLPELFELIGTGA